MSLMGASVGRAILDPIAAVVISWIAIKECVALWRGEDDDRCAALGFDDPEGDDCCARLDFGDPEAMTVAPVRAVTSTA